MAFGRDRGVCRCEPGSIFVLVLLVLLIFVGRVFIFLIGIILIVLVAVLGLAELLIEDLVDARLHSLLGLLPGKFGFELSCDSLQDGRGGPRRQDGASPRASGLRFKTSLKGL